MKNKCAQITIFIIVGVLVVSAISVYFLAGIKPTKSIKSTTASPKNIIAKCVRDVVRVSINKMMLNGGQIKSSLSIKYQGIKYNYLCYQADLYLGCYNIHPMLERQIENQIFEDTKEDVQSCFNSMREELENKGYTVDGGKTQYSIDLLPSYVKINLHKRIDTKSPTGASQTLNNFDTQVLSPIYGLVTVARNIVNSESQFCNFEYNGYMLLYPQYDIKRTDYSGSKIYSVIDRKAGVNFRFAVRSCAFMP